MEDCDELTILQLDNVIISRVGDSGEEEFEPATVKISTVCSRDMKGWIVAKNHFGHCLVFNAIVPSGAPIQMFKEDCCVRFGKVPSLSYVNKLGKPIPTIWKF